MNATAIISIPDGEPERLFPDRSSIKERYHALLKEWHPDVNRDPQAEKVATKVRVLYDAAVKKLKGGDWRPPGMAEFTGRDGKLRRIKYRAQRPFELGELLIGKSLATFVIDKKHEDLVIRGLKRIGSVRYPNEKFKQDLGQYLPKVEKTFETEASWVVSIRKDPGEVLLSDLVTHLGGQVDPRHAMWLLSSLSNLACFLEVAGVCLNGIAPGTVFVNPERHAVSLLGGWWYASKPGDKIISLPPETYRLASSELKRSKIASHDLDLESIRAAVRFALGDPSGGTFRMRKDVRPEFAEFLKSPPPRTALKSYQDWTKVLDSFGPRRFLKLDVTSDQVYPEGEH